MAISRVTSQDTTGTGVTSASATYPNPPTPGNLLIAVIFSSGNGTQAISTAGWAYVNGTNSSSAVSVSFKSAQTNEASLVATITDGSSTAMNLWLFEYTGFTNVATIDVSVVIPNGSSVSMPCGTTPVTGYSEELLIAVGYIFANNTLSSWSNSFTSIATLSGTRSVFIAERIVTAKGAYTTTATTTSTAGTGDGMISTFRAKSFQQSNMGKYVSVGDGMSRSEVAN